MAPAASFPSVVLSFGRGRMGQTTFARYPKIPLCQSGGFRLARRRFGFAFIAAASGARICS